LQFINFLGVRSIQNLGINFSTAEKGFHREVQNWDQTLWTPICIPLPMSFKINLIVQFYPQGKPSSYIAKDEKQIRWMAVDIRWRRRIAKKKRNSICHEKYWGKEKNVVFKYRQLWRNFIVCTLFFCVYRWHCCWEFCCLGMEKCSLLWIGLMTFKIFIRKKLMGK